MPEISAQCPAPKRGQRRSASFGLIIYPRSDTVVVCVQAQYREQGSAMPWIRATLNPEESGTFVSSYHLTGLEPGKVYEVQARTKCKVLVADSNEGGGRPHRAEWKKCVGEWERVGSFRAGAGQKEWEEEDDDSGAENDEANDDAEEGGAGRVEGSGGKGKGKRKRKGKAIPTPPAPAKRGLSMHSQVAGSAGESDSGGGVLLTPTPPAAAIAAEPQLTPTQPLQPLPPRESQQTVSSQEELLDAPGEAAGSEAAAVAAPVVEQLEQEQEAAAVIVEQPQPQQEDNNETQSVADEETVPPPGHAEAAAVVAMGEPPQHDAEADEEAPQPAPEPEPEPAAPAAVAPAVMVQPDVECQYGACNAQATVVFRPCGHRVLCLPCYAALRGWLASRIIPSFFCPHGLACVPGQDVQGVVELPPAAVQQLNGPPVICGAHGCGNEIGRRRYFNCRAIPGNDCQLGFSPFCYDCSRIHHNTCPSCGEESYVDVWPQ